MATNTKNAAVVTGLVAAVVVGVVASALLVNVMGQIAGKLAGQAAMGTVGAAILAGVVKDPGYKVGRWTLPGLGALLVAMPPPPLGGGRLAPRPYGLYTLVP